MKITKIISAILLLLCIGTAFTLNAGNGDKALPEAASEMPTCGVGISHGINSSTVYVCGACSSPLGCNSCTDNFTAVLARGCGYTPCTYNWTINNLTSGCSISSSSLPHTGSISVSGIKGTAGDQIEVIVDVYTCSGPMTIHLGTASATYTAVDCQ